MTEVKRSDALQPPPREVLCSALNLDSVRIEWLAGDGSDRCYYRLSSAQSQNTYVLMQLSESDAAALAQDGYDWLKVAAILLQSQIYIPKPIKALPAHAALIIEDYGDTMLESVVLGRANDSDVTHLYGQCFSILSNMIRITGDDHAVWKQRAFDRDKYMWELNFFLKKYVTTVTKLNLSRNEQLQFAKETDLLAQYLAKFSNVFCHRDFHSRNIMVRGAELALIDFQDARLGSPVYDLVSLVFDNYVPFEQKFRRQLLERGLLDLGLKNLSKRHIAAVILQRQLKAIGTYGFLTREKKRGDYLVYVKPALDALERDLVFDQEWPFISETLVCRLRKDYEGR